MVDKNTNGIVTSESAARMHRLRLVRPGKNIATAVGLLIVLAAIVATGWLLWRQHLSHVSSKNAHPVRSHMEIVTDNALNQANGGDYNGAVINLDQEINRAVTNKDKGALAETKSALALNAGQYQDGLQFAQQAEKLNPTDSSAYLIASNAEALGDKATALSYYKQALSRASPDTYNRSPDVIDMYKQKIAELQK